MATRLLTTNDILDGHVSLDIGCLDRIDLNGYVPNLQVGGQVVQFLAVRGFPIPSPAVVNRIGERFRESVYRFAGANRIPVVKFKKGDRKIEVMGRHIARQAATGRTGVAAVGTAQEFQRVATCTTRAARNGGAPHFSWDRADRRVSRVYFYLWDEDFGPGFIKITSYFPYPIKIWLTATSGQNGKPRRPASRSRLWPTASPPLATRPGCRRSVTGSGRARSTCSSNRGWRGCLFR